jgi:hypothetical protein
MRHERLSEAVATVGELGEDAAMLGRLTYQIPRYLPRPLGIEAARRRVRQGLVRRQQRFLDLADRAIYANARSPYRLLLRHVGCERALA